MNNYKFSFDAQNLTFIRDCNHRSFSRECSHVISLLLGTKTQRETLHTKSITDIIVIFQAWNLCNYLNA